MKIQIKAITFILILCLCGCTSIPKNVIIAPDILLVNDTNHNKQTQLDVVDMRTANHIVQILQEGEAATLISAQESIENTIKKTLTKQWVKQGLTISDGAANVINVSIEKAIINVAQETMAYKVKTDIVLKVTIENGSQTLTNTFSNSGTSDGPLKADIAVLERNFNHRLATLLQQVLISKKITNFLK